MLVFSHWGYNHYKLFANALGLHHRVMFFFKKEAVVGIKRKTNHEMTLKKNTSKTTKHKINPTPLTRFS